MYQNDIFYFLKIIFEINTLKNLKHIKIIIFYKKNLIFWERGANRVPKRAQNLFYRIF